MWLVALAVAWLVAFVSIGGLLFAEGRRAERERTNTLVVPDVGPENAT